MNLPRGGRKGLARSGSCPSIPHHPLILWLPKQLPREGGREVGRGAQGVASCSVAPDRQQEPGSPGARSTQLIRPQFSSHWIRSPRHSSASLPPAQPRTSPSSVDPMELSPHLVSPLYSLPLTSSHLITHLQAGCQGWTSMQSCGLGHQNYLVPPDPVRFLHPGADR